MYKQAKMKQEKAGESKSLSKERRNKMEGGIVKTNSKILVLSSRGTTHIQRHLMNDIIQTLAHAKRDAKFDTKSQLYQLNELSDLYGCNVIMFFEARKKQDLYLWLSRASQGPTIKFYCQNLFTMDELNLHGNSMLGTAPILSFSHHFDSIPHLKLAQRLLESAFSPVQSKKVRPFVDRVTTFTFADDRIWYRNWEIKRRSVEKKNDVANDLDQQVELVEIGPRFVLTPILVMEGSFQGPVIYENKRYVSPNQVRSILKDQHAHKYKRRADAAAQRHVRSIVNKPDPDPLSKSSVFG